MKRMLSVQFVFGLALAAGLIGLPREAHSEFYVIPAGMRVGTEIRALPFTISAPGFYYVARDLTSTGNGIVVQVDNVTVDLMGYSLTGPGSGLNYGVFMNGRVNVEVRNGTVRNFGQNGVCEQDSQNGRGHRVLNVRALGNKSTGIQLWGQNCAVKDCTALDNLGDGIFVGPGSSVSGCQARSNGGNGIYGNGRNLVTGNVSTGNGGNGITAVGGSTIAGNTAAGNGAYGISGASGCTVTGNTAADNISAGIEVLQGSYSGSTVSNNTASGNGTDGIVVGASTRVTGNTAYSNQNYGISLNHNCLVDDNLAYSNNLSGGAFTNMSACSECTLGTNHAP